MNAENGELLKEFTADQVVKLETIIAKHKAKQGGLIPVLEEAQVALEYLPISVQKKIARELNLPFSRVRVRRGGRWNDAGPQVHLRNGPLPRHLRSGTGRDRRCGCPRKNETVKDQGHAQPIQLKR